MQFKRHNRLLLIQKKFCGRVYTKFHPSTHQRISSKCICHVTKRSYHSVMNDTNAQNFWKNNCKSPMGWYPDKCSNMTNWCWHSKDIRCICHVTRFSYQSWMMSTYKTFEEQLQIVQRMIPKNLNMLEYKNSIWHSPSTPNAFTMFQEFSINLGYHRLRL